MNGTSGRSAAVSFQSTSTRLAFLGRQQGQFGEWSLGGGDDPFQEDPESARASGRSIARSNRSVLYSSEAARPSSVSAVVIARSNWAACCSRATDSRGIRPGRVAALPPERERSQSFFIEPLRFLEGEEDLK